ncbi:MAG: RNA 2',3'-cyclic phosphodiesterase [Candidatus Eremiobacteraeota bacterium]|nr:RNA 2',3'-cyclic phosphodiesterase [Candidatus Eremiobacteraeota bacterium]
MRLFAAIDLDDAARRFSLEIMAQLERAGVAARFEPPEKLHLTVAFLGQVSPDLFGDVTAAAATAAARTVPFSLTLDRIGAFPNLRRARAVWIGSSRPSPGYAQCASAVRLELVRLGWSFEDESIAHVTVARAKTPLRDIPAIAMPMPVELQVEALHLYESVPAGRTTRYIDLATFPLTAPNPNNRNVVPRL